MRQIFVDTRDKVPGGTNSNFSILLPQTLSLGPGHQGRIDDFRLPVSIPTIYSGNNSIVLDMNGTIHTVYLPRANTPAARTWPSRSKTGSGQVRRATGTSRTTAARCR